MQHKLKAALRSPNRKKAHSSAEETNQHHGTIDSHVEQNTAFHGARDPSTSSGSLEGSTHTARSRPLTSVYEPASESSAVDYAQPQPSDSNGSIANDYKTYLPILSPVDNTRDEQYNSLGGDQRLINGENDGRHEENVADRNINRYSMSRDTGHEKPLPMLPNSTNTHENGLRTQDANNTTGASSYGSTIRAVPPDASAGQTVPNVNAPQPPPKELPARQGMPVKHRGEPPAASTNVTDGSVHRDGQTNWRAQQQSLLDGVVNLRDTVDTDRDVQMAPAVTHEIIKLHEHEVIQRKIYREIHNYTYYNRLQPVIHTEVLPPRHFIPNPSGEGLIEISADELPTRTGEHRWWDIVQKPLPQSENTSQRRTEPEVIEGKTYITDEGFERKETTILYPPTLKDMTGYGGLVQPVHFDHKTGERWLGEMTTMDTLREQLTQVSETDTMKFKELRDSLPDLPPSPTVKRKPVDW
ncbi:Nn.00g019910.m01.CDS01 [Neocucurbitaria sp. VM-36]